MRRGLGVDVLTDGNMGYERYYIFTNPGGDICLVSRITGAFSDLPFPVQMRDEWGKVLPYAEQGSHNYGCLPLHMNAPGEFFQRIMISQEQFALIGHPNFYCYHYDRQRRQICLRPGHQRVRIDAGIWGSPDKEYYKTEVNDSDNLELCNIAYGGRPIYWIKWDSEKAHTDFPELAQQGCLHPLKYKPRGIYDPNPHRPRHNLSPAFFSQSR